MKISKVVYKPLEEVKDYPRYDLNILPKKMKWFLKPVAWLLAFPETIACHTKVRKHGMKGLKGGYLLLCNHNSFVDFKVATKAIFPRGANYVVAIDGFINREKLLRNVGCICKRKFIPDAGLVKQLKYSIFHNHYIAAVYPEARYSLTGTTSILPDSLGKMIKLFKAPVVTLICHGNHLRQPVWNLKKRKVHTSADMTYILTPQDIENMTVEQINEKVKGAFYYDDYEYQLLNHIEIKEKFRAEHIDKILYKCPNCGDEHSMKSEGTKLWCDHCHKTYEMDTLGRMHATEGITEFEHIPDWFEWERSEVRKEILAGTYRIESEVHIDSLPNSSGYYRLGEGTLVHDLHGFHLKAKLGESTTLNVDKLVSENYGVHIEFDYFGKGDGLSFSLSNDTYYLFPVKQDIHVTKVHFAVEELYKIQIKNQ